MSLSHVPMTADLYLLTYQRMAMQRLEHSIDETRRIIEMSPEGLRQVSTSIPRPGSRYQACLGLEVCQRHSLQVAIFVPCCLS